ncbi:calcineurin-like phosphoesterase family protein [Micrococcaceae bacterium RIT802]|nr:calcineurin-like phosphoesterase family protein [Micrococcaceae bacterium RIT 802]
MSTSSTPPDHHRRPRRSTRRAAAALAVVVAGSLIPAAASATPAQKTPSASGWADSAYRGSVDVVRAKKPAADPAQQLSGVVFNDKDQDSHQDRGERGIAGTKVSNGRIVTTTDANGRYTVPVYENMTVFVTQPRGFQVPVDGDNVAQFSYHHLPEGSPELKYGGIQPTGALPKAVNFPLAKDPGTAASEQHCLIGGDIQTYDQKEVEYARQGAFGDLAQRTDYTSCGALFIGDVVGNDLSLYPQTRELTGMLNGPARFLPGNHDIDFDATDSAHSFDTFKQNLGPEYYSYDTGKTHVIALNTVEYPMKVPAAKGDYKGSIDPQQLEWLRRDIANTPKDKLIVLASHIPILDFADQEFSQHQVKQAQEIYGMLKGRKAVEVAGHTHSLENLRTGDSTAGWRETFGVKKLPFPHLTAGAIAGDWFSGPLTEAGYPTAVQRDGALPGVLTLDIKGNKFTERFTVRGDDDDQMALGLNTPRYRDWYEANETNKGKAPAFDTPHEVSRADLGDDSWLTVNVFMGSTGSKVVASIDGKRARKATRTQQMQGEAQNVGAEFSDPAATQVQLVHGGSLADRSMHLWRLRLPESLKPGKHTASVTTTDIHGRSFTEKLKFTVTD